MTVPLRPPDLSVVIGSIRLKAFRNDWTRGQAKGPSSEWTRKLRRSLSALEAADRPEHMDNPRSCVHPRKGDRPGRYVVRLTARCRVTSRCSDGGAVDVDIEDDLR